MSRRLLLLLVVTILGFSSAFASLIEVSGVVSGTWNADTVLVINDIQVENGQQLHIAAGTRVIFWSHFKMEILGTLVAQGQPGDSIVFTVRDTANFYNQNTDRGGWFGIRFKGTSAENDTSIFTFCRFEYGKALGDSADQYGGAIFVKNFSKIKITHCLFYHNYSYYSGGAVYLWNADGVVTNNTFSANYAGNNAGIVYGYGGGVCAMHCSPKVVNNTFTGNSSTGVGGGVSFDDCNPSCYNNVFQNNSSGLGGALGVLRSSPVSTISNLLITNNSAVFFGGGVCCIRSFPIFSNLTIANNTSSYGGGFYCNDSAAPSVYNSIIYNNSGLGVSVYIWDIRSAPNFYYCDIEGDTSGFEGSGAHGGYQGIYQNNLNEPPMFYGYGLFPYQLSGNSPCINSVIPDAGFLDLPQYDLSGAPRIWDDRIDMGAYEYNGTTSVTENSEYQDDRFIISPNPVLTELTLVFQKPQTWVRHFMITDLQGKTVLRFEIPAGCDKFQLGEIVSGLQSGLYLIMTPSATQQAVKQFIKL